MSSHIRRQLCAGRTVPLLARASTAYAAVGAVAVPRRCVPQRRAVGGIAAVFGGGTIAREFSCTTAVGGTMASMQAVQVREPGGVEQLFVGNVAVPSVGDGESLVHVRATAVNRADCLQRRGRYPPPEGASDIIGLEVAGTVGEGGERVMALLAGGGYAQRAVVPTDLLIPVPANLSFDEAASIPEAYLTAYQALFWLGQLSPGQTVFLHSGASGVGTAAIQLVKSVADTTVIVSVGSQAKMDFCKSLGADHAINRHDESFADKVAEYTDGRGVDLLLDFVGGPNFAPNMACMAVDGVMISLGFLAGPVCPDGFSMAPILRKRLTIKGTTLRARPLAYKAKLTKEFAAYAVPLFESGVLKPVVAKTFAMEQVADAHTYMEANLNIGKIVLQVPQ